MKTTLLVGVMAVAAMNLVACVPGIGGCDVGDPEVDSRVAPLTFDATTTTAACDANLGVVLDLKSAQGSAIRIAVKPSARVGYSLPLTADAASSEGSTVASSSSDGAVNVTLTDAEYNELPSGWQSAAITIDAFPTRAGQSLSGDLHFYFADGRALDVSFDNIVTTACSVPTIN